MPSDDIMLVPVVTVLVHPINTERHPNTPAGYRWAVQVGGHPPGDMRFVANAGHTIAKDEALSTGDRCAAAALVALRLFGIPATLQYQELDFDPVPENPAVRIIGRRG
jgi:hypothetical protein